MIYKTEEKSASSAKSGMVLAPKANKKKRKAVTTAQTYDYVASYIPDSIYLGYLLKKHPMPLEKLKGTTKPAEIKDNMLFLLGTISRLQTRDKDSVIRDSGFVRMYSPILQQRVSDYSTYINWALDRQLIQCDGIYIKGSKSLAYRFNPNLGSKLRMHSLYKKNLLKANHRLGVCKKTINKYPELWKYHQLLEIDLQGVNLEIESLRTPTRLKIYKKKISDWTKQGLSESKIQEELDYWEGLTLNSWRIAAENIDRQAWLFKQDDKVGRLHTNLTGLKKELRKHLTVKGKKLIAVDIKNSQPFFASTLFITENWKKLDLMIKILKSNPGLCHSKFHYTKPTHTPYMLEDLRGGKSSQTILDFCLMAQIGRLYEHMEYLYEKNMGKHTTREKMKDMFLKMIFSPTWQNEEKKFYKVLRQEHPDILAFFEWCNTGFERIKKGLGIRPKIGEKDTRTGKAKPRTSEDQTSALALLLQTLEAQLILDKAIPLIQKEHPNLFVATIHDSIVTTQGNEYEVYSAIIKAALDFLGEAPTLEIEYAKWGLN